LLELLKARGRLPKFDAGLDAFCLVEDPELRAPSLKLISDLRAAGLAVDYSLAPAKSDKQFKRAQELKAACTVRLDRSADGALLARIRHFKSGQERRVAPAEAAAAVTALGAGAEAAASP
jgi:histidyl-tRNA synthetase